MMSCTKKERDEKVAYFKEKGWPLVLGYTWLFISPSKDKYKWRLLGSELDQRNGRGSSDAPREEEIYFYAPTIEDAIDRAKTLMTFNRKKMACYGMDLIDDFFPGILPSIEKCVEHNQNKPEDIYILMPAIYAPEDEVW